MADIKSSQEWMIAKIDAHQERMEVSMNAWWNKMVYQEVTEVCPERTETDQELAEAKIKTGLVEWRPQIWKQILKEKWQ
jgi:hypothetical protein